MIYQALKNILLALIQGPTGPPEPPAGSPASVRTFRASTKYLGYNLVVMGILFSIFLAITGLVALLVTLDKSALPGVQIFIWVLPGLVLLGGMVAYFATRLEYDMRYYVVTDRSLRIREGVWTITEATLTFANVQHLEINQGPVQQMLGIADLFVRTAGGGTGANSKQAGLQHFGLLGMLLASSSKRPRQGHECVFRGIENAAAIRDQINQLLKRYRDAGLGDLEDHRAHPLSRAKAGWSPAGIERLKEICDELRAWRKQVELPQAITAKPQPPKP